MSRDSGVKEGMPNPPTVNRRSIYWKCIIYNYYYKPSTNREMLDRTMGQVDHFGSVSKCAADQMLPYAY